MAPNPELAAKIDRIGRWLGERGAGAVLLSTAPNVSWLACGGEVLRPDSRVGFVVAGDRCWFLSPGDDIERIRQEELRGLGIDLVGVAALGVEALVARARGLLSAGTRWTSDRPGLGFEHDPSIDRLRTALLPEEIERLRKVARDAASALEDVATECYRGILEHEAAARLVSECVHRHLTPRLVLAGADERLEQYIRPVPKSTGAEHVLALALVVRRGGLHVALSRMVCLVPPKESLLDRFDTLARLAARLSSESRPGQELGRIVQRSFPAQVLGASPGGLAGYALPEVEAVRDCAWTLEAGQALAWTLATPGVLCYETSVVDAAGCQPITVTEDWPRRTVEVAGRSYEIPDLLLV